MDKKLYYYVKLKAEGTSYAISANQAIANSKGETPTSLAGLLKVFQCDAVIRNFSFLKAFCERKSTSKTEDGTYIMSEEVLEELLEKKAEKDPEITKELQLFVDNYDTNKLKTEETLKDYCLNTRKFGKTRTEKIVNSMMARYPSRNTILSRSKIKILLNYIGTTPDSENEVIKNAIEDSQKFQKLSEYKDSMLRCFLPMWKHLSSLLNQVAEEGEMSERTLNALRKATSKTEDVAQYLSTVENISVENIEISSHELEALAFVAPLAIHSEVYAENILLAIFKEARYLGIECELPEVPNYSFDELIELSETAESLRDMSKRIAEAKAEENAEGDGEE